MKCLNCNRNNAIKDPLYGFLPCLSCQKKAEKPSEPVEFTTDDIKNQRKMMKKDIIQPFRDGHLSKEYVKTWGTKRLKVSDDEIKNAKNVWDDDINYYKDEI